MEKLIVRETPRTPSINFDPETGSFDISGKSTPENSMGFYAPVIDYIDRYTSCPADKTVVNIKFEFFNTSSSNSIHSIFKRFEKVYMENRDVVIKWYYDSSDENMLDAGEDFKAILHIPFEIIKVDES
jgi:hypothetical protein